MTNYWKDHFNANALLFPESPLKQVANTVNGREVDTTQFQLIVDAIVSRLELSGRECVADLCCGNGVVTRHIARRCEKVLAVDFSENLIANARSLYPELNVEYMVGDVTMLSQEFLSGVDKAFMCYALQHLTVEGFSSLVRQMCQQSRFRSFFISGIPDAERQMNFYDTSEKLAFYKEREREGKPHLGTWWNRQELSALVANFGLKIEIIDQPMNQFSSHYRFDCLVRSRN